MASVGRVLIIVQNLPVPFDRRVWLEATALRAAGYTVSVICPTGKGGGKEYLSKYEVIDHIHIYRYPAAPAAKGVLSYLFEFAYCWLRTAILSIRVCRSRGIDIIHACNPPDTYFLLAWVYKWSGRKFIFDHHDLSPEMYVAKGGKPGGVLHRGLLWFEKMTFKTADAVIATNLSHKEIALLRGNVRQNLIFVVRSGPDFKRLKMMEPEPALKKGSRFMACYLGEMCPQDGVDYLLRAARVLYYDLQRRDIRFVLMGGGPALQDLKSLRTEMGLNEIVEFTGRVSDFDLCRYLSTADICLDPDPHTEWADKSTMNKIMEYMAFGKPIVAYDLKEHRYSAQEAGVYAKPNDERHFAALIGALLEDPERRHHMGQIGLARVKTELAWDYSIPNLLAAYAQIMKS